MKTINLKKITYILLLVLIFGTSVRIPALPETFIASAKSLYASPMDGLITSLLILTIVFVTYKVVRR